jgi:DNA-binding GntR family transcriptional regulator
MLKRENLSDQLADVIGKRIIQNELKSGERISILQISKEFEVSQSPVRDALHLLEKKRLVERMPKGSFQVMKMTYKFQRDLFDATLLVFKYINAKAAEHASDADIRQLKEGFKDFDKSNKRNDPELFLSSLDKYVTGIVHAAGNKLIGKMALELLPSILRIEWDFLQADLDNLKIAVEKTKNQLQYIVNRQPEKATEEFINYTSLHAKAPDEIDSIKKNVA